MELFSLMICTLLFFSLFLEPLVFGCCASYICPIVFLPYFQSIDFVCPPFWKHSAFTHSLTTPDFINTPNLQRCLLSSRPSKTLFNTLVGKPMVSCQGWEGQPSAWRVIILNGSLPVLIIVTASSHFQIPNIPNPLEAFIVSVGLVFRSALQVEMLNLLPLIFCFQFPELCSCGHRSYPPLLCRFMLLNIPSVASERGFRREENWMHVLSVAFIRKPVRKFSSVFCFNGVLLEVHCRPSGSSGPW